MRTPIALVSFWSWYGNEAIARSYIEGVVDVMEAAKDLLKRAVALDSARKPSEALICYEEGVQNLLRAMGGTEMSSLAAG